MVKQKLQITTNNTNIYTNLKGLQKLHSFPISEVLRHRWAFAYSELWKATRTEWVDFTTSQRWWKKAIEKWWVCEGGVIVSCPPKWRGYWLFWKDGLFKKIKKTGNILFFPYKAIWSFYVTVSVCQGHVKWHTRIAVSFVKKLLPIPHADSGVPGASEISQNLL